MSHSQKSKLSLTIIILAVAALSSGLTEGIVSFIGREGKEPLPHRVVRSQPSPDGTTIALLFHVDTGDPWDFLGAGQRYYLGLRKKGVTYIISRDLTEGGGIYEGGVYDLRWLNDDQILLERIISDRREDIIFDLAEEQWKAVGKPE